MFNKKPHECGQFVLELKGEIIGEGGYLSHYTPPFADLHLEVSEKFRGRGFGAIILQHLKKQCYAEGLIPAARCNINNGSSKGALLKSGMKVAGMMLMGKIKI